MTAWGAAPAASPSVVASFPPSGLPRSALPPSVRRRGRPRGSPQARASGAASGCQRARASGQSAQASVRWCPLLRHDVGSPQPGCRGMIVPMLRSVIMLRPADTATAVSPRGRTASSNPPMMSGFTQPGRVVHVSPIAPRFDCSCNSEDESEGPRKGSICCCNN